MTDDRPPQSHHAPARLDPITGRRLFVVAYPPEPPVSDDKPEPTADKPKPKRRSAFRHALGGLALCGCLLFGVWMLERAKWTDIGGTWRRAQIGLSGGRQGVRDQVQVGMTQTEVRQRIGYGDWWYLSKVTVVEEYPDCAFQVVYRGVAPADGDWVVERVEDIHAPGSLHRRDR